MVFTKFLSRSHQSCHVIWNIMIGSWATLVIVCVGVSLGTRFRGSTAWSLPLSLPPNDITTVCGIWNILALVLRSWRCEWRHVIYPYLRFGHSKNHLFLRYKRGILAKQKQLPLAKKGFYPSAAGLWLKGFFPCCQKHQTTIWEPWLNDTDALIVQVPHRNYSATTAACVAAFERPATINQVESILFI